MDSRKDWQRLAKYAARRRAELSLTQIEVAQRGPLSLDRVQAIEGAKSSRYRLGTLVALERALDWTEGSVERILAGGEPNVVHHASAHLRAESRMEARLDPPTKAAVEAFLARPVPTDEELRASALKPETVEALIAMRERFARWAAEGDEDQIRRAGRLTEALDEERDAG
jgi:hypothetical protein